MKILYVASEAVPFASAGGLGDVIGSLPAAVSRRLGPESDVRAVIPLYPSVREKFGDQIVLEKEFYVPLSWRKQYCGIWSISKDNVKFYLYSKSADAFDTYNGDNIVIAAEYDEDVLKEAGIVLKKNKDSLPNKVEDITDYKYYTVSGLGPRIEITDDTDTTPFIAVVDAATEKIKEKAQDGDDDFQWAKDNEIFPTEFYLKKGKIGGGYISYADKDGNLLAWVELDELNSLNEDGTWCKNEWMAYKSVDFIHLYKYSPSVISSDADKGRLIKVEF